MTSCSVRPTYDLQIIQGDSFTKTFTLYDGEKNPIDLTGASARLQIRTDVNSSVVQLELVNGSGITLGGVAGTVLVEMTPLQTLLPKLQNNPGVYDLEINDQGIVTTYVGGRVFLIREVTRD